MIAKTTLAAACASLFASAAMAQVPAGYPADYQKIIDGAKKEGKLVIYGATDSKATQPLVKDFNALYPGITVEYNDMNSTEVYNRFISEAAAGGNTADAVWSSAMDLQMRLASDGYALQYKSVEVARSSSSRGTTHPSPAKRSATIRFCSSRADRSYRSSSDPK